MSKKIRRVFFLGSIICCLAFGGAVLLRQTSDYYLSTLLNGEGEPKYNAWIYYLPGESDRDIEAKVSAEQIEELLQNRLVKEGPAFYAMPCPAFQIYINYEDKSYGLVIGMDGQICLYELHETNEEIFLRDSGELFECLYEYHIHEGGKVIL